MGDDCSDSAGDPASDGLRGSGPLGRLTGFFGWIGCSRTILDRFGATLPPFPGDSCFGMGGDGSVGGGASSRNPRGP